MENGARTSYYVCPLCEATCGLEIRTRGREVVGIRGDEADVFSHGFICPKAYALKELDADPDRVRVPLVRRDGVLAPATWDEAFAEIDRRLGPILREHGRDAVAVYLGNPSAHSLALGLYAQVLPRAHGLRGERAPLHPPRHRRVPALRHRARALRRGPGAPRAARAARGGRRASGGAGARLPARGGRSALRDRCRGDPSPGARAGR